MIGAARAGRLALLAALLAGSACAGATLTPAQEQVSDAFAQCKVEAPSARLEEVATDGRFRYSAGRGADHGIMRTCLWERHRLKAIGD